MSSFGGEDVPMEVLTQEILTRINGWARIHYCFIHHCTIETDRRGSAIWTRWVIRTTSVLFSRVKTKLQKFKFWSIFFASIFDLKNYVWRSVVFILCCCVFVRWRVLREWMSCSGDEIMRMSMIGRSDLPWPPKCAILLLTSCSRLPNWICRVEQRSGLGDYSWCQLTGLTCGR
jgi:hypothetical protein